MDSTILKSLLRTFFLDLAIETAYEKVSNNFRWVPLEGGFPRTSEELLRMHATGELLSKYGIDDSLQNLKDCLYIYGEEFLLRHLEAVCVKDEVKEALIMKGKS